MTILSTAILQKKPPSDRFTQRRLIQASKFAYDGRGPVGKGQAAPGAKTVLIAGTGLASAVFLGLAAAFFAVGLAADLATDLATGLAAVFAAGLTAAAGFSASDFLMAVTMLFS